MQITKRIAPLALLTVVALATLSCKNPAQNSNQQNSNQPPPVGSTARWVAQFRSPSSVNVTGTNLASFFYSSISVVSPDVVYAAGDMPDPKSPLSSDNRVSVVVRTTDGGQTWKESIIEQPGMKIPTLNSICFVDEKIGWGVGADAKQAGVILKTTDGGSTWATSKLAFKQVPTSILFVDADTGWMGGVTPLAEDEDELGGPSDLLGTTDGGRTWQSQRRLPVSIEDIFFLDKMTGWAVGGKGAVYHTSDGGRSWNSQRSELEPREGPVDLSQPQVKYAIMGVHFVNPQNGFVAVAGEEKELGMVLGTTDGGAVWRRQWMVADSGVRDVVMVSPNEAWAATNKGRFIYHTTDGGQTWLGEPIEFEQELQIFRLGAANASRAWAVGGGAIYYRVKNR